MNKIAKVLIPIIILLVGVIAIFFLFQNRETETATQSADNFALVSSQAPQLLEASPQIIAWGQITSGQQAQLSPASAGATIEAVNVTLGDAVSAGDALVVLDQSSWRYQAEQLRAQQDELAAQRQAVENRQALDQQALALEREQLAVAQREVDRIERLLASNLATPQQLEQAQNQLRTAQQAVNSRQLAIANGDTDQARFAAQARRLAAQLADVENSLVNATLSAPFDGVISQVNAKVGERAPSSPLITLTGIQRKVSTWIPAQYANQDIEGQLWIDNRLVPASAVNISNQAQGGAVEAELVLANDASLVAGRYGQAILSLASVDAIKVPAASIYGERLIYQVREGQLYDTEVNILGRRLESGTEYVLIDPAGVNMNDRILTTRLDEAAPGLRVKEVE